MLSTGTDEIGLLKIDVTTRKGIFQETYFKKIIMTNKN